MTVRRLTLKALAMLLPAGVLGISSALAATPAKPAAVDLTAHEHAPSVAARLGEIRAAVSAIDFAEPMTPAEAAAVTSEWPNFHFGWGNGGWRNGGWRNGGWGNGGGWRNGGWGNGGPWHNWHNFWHNW
ncbi:MAG TPA: GrrA/OscA1 family cyclophane-containing rSAM-modified RiPP [Candidatus Acidoferrales bacterium]